MRNWENVLGKEARKRSCISLEDITKKEKDLTEVDKFYQLKEVELLTRELVREARRGYTVSPKELRSLVLWLCGCLLFGSLIVHFRAARVIRGHIANWRSHIAEVTISSIFLYYFV